MEDTLIVSKREKLGKVETKRLRAQGLIPATVYGLGEPAVSVAIDPKLVARVISSEHGINSVIYMQREGTDIKRHVIIKDAKGHPVTRRLMHVDFLRVDPTHRVKVTVPIVLKGNPIGVKEGGTLEFIHRDITVECLPAFIPSNWVPGLVEELAKETTTRIDETRERKLGDVIRDRPPGPPSNFDTCEGRLEHVHVAAGLERMGSGLHEAALHSGQG